MRQGLFRVLSGVDTAGKVEGRSVLHQASGWGYNLLRPIPAAVTVPLYWGFCEPARTLR